MYRHFLRHLPLIGLLCALALPALAPTRAAAADPPTAPAKPIGGEHVVSRAHRAMGTEITVAIWTADAVAAGTAIDAVFAEIDRIEALMTSWTDSSAVAKIIAAAGDKRGVAVDDEVLKVLLKAEQIARKTAGAFDITVGAYRGLWKLDQDRDESIPTASEINARRKLVRWRRLKIDRKTGRVRLTRKGMRITLGGIAKGYAIDRAVELLRARKLHHFLVQGGGDLYVSGRRGNRPWRVGIRDPRGPSTSYFAMAEVTDRTFSTSGDYERAFVRDDVRYHHILDPRTGRPARRCRSVTVMASDALTADALSTALFVMGPRRGMALVEKMADVEAVFVGANNKVTISRGLRDKVKILRPPSPGI